MRLSESCYKATKQTLFQRENVFPEGREDTRAASPLEEHQTQRKKKSANVLTDEILSLPRGFIHSGQHKMDHFIESPCGYTNVQTVTKYVV